MRLGRSTGHPGRASTTPEMSVTGPDGRTEPVPAWCTPHEALTRTRAAAGSNHRTRGPNHRIVIISELGRFAGPTGSRATAAGSSSRRVHLAASITAEALRHLGLAEDTELMSPVIRSARKSCPVSGSGPSTTCSGSTVVTITVPGRSARPRSAARPRCPSRPRLCRAWLLSGSPRRCRRPPAGLAASGHAGTGRSPGPGQAAQSFLLNMTQRNPVPVRSLRSAMH